MKCSALISIDKWIISSESESIRCREYSEIGFAVMPPIDRSRERGFQHSVVANAVSPAEQ